MGDSTKSCIRAAKEAMAKGDLREALRCARAALKHDKKSYEALVWGGKITFQLAEYAQSDAAYRMATDVNPTALPAWMGLAELHGEAGTQDAGQLAAACARVVVLLEQSGDAARLLDFRRRLARAYAAARQVAEARQAWQQVLATSDCEVELEARSGVANAELQLFDQEAEKAVKKRISGQKKAAKSASWEDEKSGADAGEVRRSVEAELATSPSGSSLDAALRSIVDWLADQSAGPPPADTWHFQERLLQLHLARVRAACREAERRREALGEVLRLCATWINRSATASAFVYETAIVMCDDDLAEELLATWQVYQDNRGEALTSKSEAVKSYLGARLGHICPGHAFHLLAAAQRMHRSTTPDMPSLARRRAMCEAALRLREDSPSGWALLATLRLEEGASASASECIRRGQLATHRLEKSLGLSLTTLQLSLRLLRGRVHRAASQLPEADAEFEAVAEAASATGGSAATVLQALQGRAEVALAGDDHVAARDRLDLVLERSPQHPWALSQRGQLALAGGDTSAAISDLQAAVALRPRDAHLHLLLGRAYWEAGGELRQRTGTGGAQAEFLEAAKLQPSNGPAFRHLGHFYRQVAGDHPRAQRCYLRAVALDAADSEAGEALCELLSEGGQGALRDATCRDAAQRSAKAYWAWRTLGLSQVAGRQWEAAVTSLQHALRGLSSDPVAWEALALAYQRLGRHTAALKAYGRGRKLQQQQGEDNSRQQGTFAVVQCGNIHLLLSAFAEAEECFREALAAAPGQVAAKYGLASALYGRAQQCVQSGAPAWAASLLQEAEAPAGECAREHGHLESAWKLLGDIQLLSSQVTPHGARLVLGGGEKPMEPEGDHHRLKESAPARAVRSYKKGLHLRPGGAAARADLAVGLCHLAAFEETPAGQHSVRRAAEKVMAGALRLQPDSAHLWALMGALAQSGPLKQHALIRSLQLEPSCAPAWAGLSQLYLAEGEEELAERAVAQARASNPSHPLPWAVTAILHFNASARQPSEAHLEEAYASSLYAAQQYPIPALQGALGAMAAHTRKLATHQVYAALGQAAALTPGRPGVQNLLGMAAEAQGLFSDAVAAYMAARDCHQCGALADRASQADAPDQQPGTKENMACVSRNLARALSKAGRPAEAAAEFQSLAAAGEIGQDSDTWQAYAVALHASRQDDLALAAAQQAVSAAEEATPAHRRAIGLLCSLFFRSGDVKSALAAFGSAPLAYRRCRLPAHSHARARLAG